MRVMLYHGPQDRKTIEIDETNPPATVRYLVSSQPILPDESLAMVQYHTYQIHRFTDRGKVNYQYHYVRVSDPELIPLPQEEEYVAESEHSGEDLAESAASDIMEPKRGRGRPRKTPVPA